MVYGQKLKIDNKTLKTARLVICYCGNLFHFIPKKKKIIIKDHNYAILLKKQCFP